MFRNLEMINTDIKEALHVNFPNKRQKLLQLMQEDFTKEILQFHKFSQFETDTTQTINIF